MTSINIEDYYTVKEISEKYNISKSTIHQWIYRGEIKKEKQHGMVFIPKTKEVENFLNNKYKIMQLKKYYK